MQRPRSGFVALLLAFVAGCSSSGKSTKPASAVLDTFAPAVLSSSGNVTTLVTMGSGAQAYMAGLMPYTLARLGGDPNCPVVDRSGNTTTVTGGCTDKSGNSFSGTIVLTTTTGATASSARIRYEQFELSSTTTCKAQPKTTSSRWNGSFTQNANLTGNGGTAFYDVDLRLDAVTFDPDTCADRSPVEGWQYHGTVTENGSVDAFDGSGRVGTSEVGVASASTTGEILDTSACSSEAASGSTTLQAGGHMAVITYDGATDCSPDGTVTWTYDGADRGTLTGIQCEVAPIAGAASAAAAALGWIAGLTALAFGWRRRARR